MKRIVSIPLMILILFSGISINVASHYCGGNLASSKVSLKGELASCGMEHQSGTGSFGDQISKHCCEDVIHSFTLSTNYIPSTFLRITDAGNAPFSAFIVYDLPLFHREIFGSLISETKLPPGTYTPVCVEQQVICVFKI